MVLWPSRRLAGTLATSALVPLNSQSHWSLPLKPPEVYIPRYDGWEQNGPFRGAEETRNVWKNRAPSPDQKTANLYKGNLHGICSLSRLSKEDLPHIRTPQNRQTDTSEGLSDLSDPDSAPWIKLSTLHFEKGVPRKEILLSCFGVSMLGGNVMFSLCEFKCRQGVCLLQHGWKWHAGCARAQVCLQCFRAFPGP